VQKIHNTNGTTTSVMSYKAKKREKRKETLQIRRHAPVHVSEWTQNYYIGFDQTSFKTHFGRAYNICLCVPKIEGTIHIGQERHKYHCPVKLIELMFLAHTQSLLLENMVQSIFWFLIAGMTRVGPRMKLIDLLVFI
jgi:hypothetical protein